MASTLRISNIESPDANPLQIDSDIELNNNTKLKGNVTDSLDNPWGIISGGNDTTGRWTKFPDGLLIQYGFGKQLASTSTTTVIYPIPFLAGTIPSWTAQQTNHHGGVIHVLQSATQGTYALGTPNVTSFAPSFLTSSLGAPTADIGFCWQAMGRWK